MSTSKKLIAMLATLAIHACTQIACGVQHYKIELLDTHRGDYYVQGIADDGAVVIDSNDYASFPESIRSYSYRYEPGGAKVLIQASAEWSSIVNGMSDSGEMAGAISSDFARYSQAALWKSDGDMRLVPPLGRPGEYSFAVDVNDQGEVLVNAVTVSDPQTSPAVLGAYVWDGRGYTTIPAPVGSNVFARQISNRGEVVGNIDHESGHDTPFYYADGSTTQMWDAGDRRGSVWAINNNGVAIGTVAVAGERLVGFTWTLAGGVVELPHSGQQFAPSDINDSGEIVGQILSPGRGVSIFDGVREAFYSRAGSEIELLADLLPEGSGWTRLISADAINDRGVIVGRGVYQDEFRFYRMVPVPEPTPAWLTSCLVVVVAMKRGRRTSPCLGYR
jgi:uncharacterized membrane protein